MTGKSNQTDPRLKTWQDRRNGQSRSLQSRRAGSLFEDTYISVSADTYQAGSMSEDTYISVSEDTYTGEHDMIELDKHDILGQRAVMLIQPRSRVVVA